MDLNETRLAKLAEIVPELSTLLDERQEILAAMSFWKASTREEAPDRVEEFQQLLEELLVEIRTLVEKFHSSNQSNNSSLELDSKEKTE